MLSEKMSSFAWRKTDMVEFIRMVNSNGNRTYPRRIPDGKEK